MLIQNYTNTKEYQQKGKKPSIIIIQSLKTKIEDPEIVLGVDQIVDTAMQAPHLTDERVENNPELRDLESKGMIKFLKEYPKGPSKEEQAKIDVQKNKEVKKDKVIDIKSSDSLTQLQDIVNNEKDVELVRAAVLRLQELEGDMMDNPEIKDGSNNIIA